MPLSLDPKLNAFNSKHTTIQDMKILRLVLESLHLNLTLEPLTTMIKDLNDPTNQIEAFYVQCIGAMTTAKLKVANAALTQFSITLVKNSYGEVEFKNPLEFAKAQYRSNVIAKLLRTFFSSF